MHCLPQYLTFPQEDEQQQQQQWRGGHSRICLTLAEHLAAFEEERKSVADVSLRKVWRQAKDPDAQSINGNRFVAGPDPAQHIYGCVV